MSCPNIIWTVLSKKKTEHKKSKIRLNLSYNYNAFISVSLLENEGQKRHKYLK